MTILNPPNDFSLSSLVIFAGIAATMLINIELKRDFNFKNCFAVCSILFISGTVGILIYGCSDGISKFAITHGDIALDIYTLNVAYYFILTGTLVLLGINLIQFIQMYKNK